MAPVHQVERACIVLRASRGETPPAIAKALGLDAETVRRRIRRFNAEGLAALEDHHRSGRPATYLPDEVAEVIATALTGPRRLGLPFASWTLDRLSLFVHEREARRRHHARLTIGRGRPQCPSTHAAARRPSTIEGCSTSRYKPIATSTERMGAAMATARGGTSRGRPRQRIALEALTPKRDAAARQDAPAAIAATTRSRRSTDSAFDMPIALSPQGN
jgi:transposase